MLPLIPAMLMMTIMVAFVVNFTKDGGQDHHASALAGNMLLQHDQAIRQIREDGVDTNTLGNLLTAPFSNLGNWDSAAVEYDGKIVIFTWSRNTSNGGISRGIDRAKMAQVSGQLGGKTIPGGGVSSFGEYIYTSDGGKVGSVEIDGFAVPISLGDYAVVSVIEGGA